MKGSEWWASEVPEGTLGDDYTLAILEAIRAGHAHLAFETVAADGLVFNIMRAPLAIGTPDDHVFLFGLSAEAVDMIAIELGKRGVEVMSPTPALYDLAAEDERAVQIGPHTLPTLLGVSNGAAGMTKRAAKAHADAVARDMSSPCAFAPACCKTYTLHPYLADPSDQIRDGYACEYGWRLPGRVGWGSKNFSRSGYVVQPAEWAHFYRHFRDYSMGAVFVLVAATLDGEAVDLRDCRRAGAVAARVAPAGPVPFVVHPECREPLTARSGPTTVPSRPSPPPWPRPVLRKGSKGEPVKRWQRALMAAGYDIAPYGDDGDFGKLTHNATVGFQRERGLPGTGVVDDPTWAAIGTEPVERDEPDGGITEEIRATNFTWANRTSVDHVVIHTIEIVEASTSADNCAKWFGSGARAPRASAHYCLDDDSTILCVPEEHVAWAAPGCNRTGIQLEHAGYARQTAEQWFDPFSRRMLARSAKITAAICKRWGIPVRFVDAAGLLRGERGITTHYQVTLGPGKGRTNHVDPGRGFPMSTYLDMVEKEMNA